MSNTAVGQVYNRVIDAVIEASKIDFEENGVNSEILGTLRRKWQERLTQTDRALYPWDPQPAVTTNESTQPGSPSNAESNVPEPNVSGSGSAAAPGPSSNSANSTQANGNNDVQVKQEQGFDSSFLNLPQQNYTSGLGSQYASQRAAHLLQQQFGSQASSSIGALQAAGMRQQQPNQGQPGRSGSDANASVKVENNSTAQVKQENSETDIVKSQTDGTDESAVEEWDAVIARRNAHGDHEPMGRIAVDRVIRRQVEAMGRRLEGGGLMLPLDERYPTHQKLKKQNTSRSAGFQAGQESGSSTSTAGNLETEMAMLNARFDGAGDSESDNEINSDLDDPDETADNSIEGMYEGDVILCLYDKVQRVKNKWKCVLKDGVVTVDGRDYVFHKASGEFEW